MSTDYRMSLQELCSLLMTAVQISKSGVSWEDRYDLIFSGVISGRIGSLAEKLNVDVQYFDPDVGGQADVEAYATMAGEVAAMLLMVINALNEPYIES